MPYIPHRPKGTTSEQTIEVPHGSTVRLRCIPVDQHAGTITWFKNNERVGNDVTNKQEYTVADVDDDFTITCVVGYKTYNATKTYHIVIKKEDGKLGNSSFKCKACNISRQTTKHPPNREQILAVLN